MSEKKNMPELTMTCPTSDNSTTTRKPAISMMKTVTWLI